MDIVLSLVMMDEIHLTKSENWDTSGTGRTGGCCTWALKWFLVISRKSRSLFVGSITISQTQLTHELFIRNYVKQKKKKPNKATYVNYYMWKNKTSEHQLESGKQQAVFYTTGKKPLNNLWIVWTAVIASTGKKPNIFTKKKKKK